MPPDEPSFGDNIEVFKLYTEVKEGDFIHDGVLINVKGAVYE